MAGRSESPRSAVTAGAHGWTFLTNHAHVVICLAGGENLTGRELALRIGITERAVQAILADLVEGHYIAKTKRGRRNVYAINSRGRLRHPLEAHHTIGDLVAAMS